MKAFTVRVKLVASLILCICIHDLSYAQIIETVVGTGIIGYSGEGIPAVSSKITNPGQLCIDQNNNLYIPQGQGHRVSLVNSAGIITTLAGNGSAGYSGDGGPATNAVLNMPNTIALDQFGNIAFVDAQNCRIRKIDKSTGKISTIAGTGVPGFSGDGGPATNAKIFYPSGICFDKKGNLYIGDKSRIRKVTPAGVISTYAGIGVSGVSGDGGPATAAKSGSGSLCVDDAGNLYISDCGTGESRIAKVDTFGIITTFAGTSIDGVYNGDNIPATAANINPVGIAIDKFGNVVFADWYNNRVRMVDKKGFVHTIAGDGSKGYGGDGGLAINASFNMPQGIAIDTCGNIYVADNNNSRIRKITFAKCGYLETDELKIADKLSVFPNPAFSTVTLSGSIPISSFAIVDILGKELIKKNLSAKPLTNIQVDVSTLPPGMYIVRVNEVWTARLGKE